MPSEYAERVHVLRDQDGDLLTDRDGLPRSFPSEGAAYDYAAMLTEGEWTAEAAIADRTEEAGYALLDELKVRVAGLEAALRIYADGWGDAGQIARAALEGTSYPTEGKDDE